MNSEKQIVKVSKGSLPVSCPQKGTPAWDMHPRVYIELTDSKSSSCPYCGAEYQIENVSN